MNFSSDERIAIIKLVRDILRSSFDKTDINVPLNLEEKFSERRGVFVTLTKNDELRGCIGFSEPIAPLGVALIRATIGAAFHDSRFPPLKREELKDINIEITVLTEPREIKGKDKKETPKKIKIGRDGLIIEQNTISGLLLPQVATEYKWTPKQFLEHTCLKAGLDKDAWLDKSTKVYSFQGLIIK